MTLNPRIGGPALRALAAGAGRPAFRPVEADAAERPRDRIWELADTLHCSIVGTCLTKAEARGLLAKLGRPDARTMTEHRLHGEVVQMAGRRDGGGRLLQKALGYDDLGNAVEMLDQNVAFRLEGETRFLHDRPTIRAVLAAEAGLCLVTGVR